MKMQCAACDWWEQEEMARLNPPHGDDVLDNPV